MTRFCNIFIAFFFLLPVLRAQDYIVNFQTYGVEEGMLHRHIQCVFEDKTGFIWTGTPIGVQRFDGYEFKWYTAAEYPLLGSISHIGQDNDGWLWFWNPETEEFSFFNPKEEKLMSGKDRFSNWENASQVLSTANSSRIALASVRVLPKDSNGKLYLGLRNPAALAVFDAGAGFRVYNVPGFNSLTVQFIDSQNFIWASEGSTLIKLSPDGSVIRTYAIDGFTTLGHFTEWENTLYFQANKGMVINDVNWYSLDQHGQIHLLATIPPGKRYHNYIHDQFWELLDNEWRVSNRDRTHVLFNLKERDYPKRMFDGVFTLPYRDSRGRVWIYGEFGLNMIDTRPNLFTRYFAFKETETKPFSNAARGILATDDRVVVNFESGGLVSFQQNEPSRYNILKTSNVFWGSANEYTGRSIYQSANGKIWVGDRYYLTGWSTDFKPMQSFSYKADATRYLEIWAIHEDAQQQVWLGADDGLFYKRPGEDYLEKYESVPLFQEGFGIYNIVDAGKGLFWLCTEEGLFLFDPLKASVVARFWKDAPEKWRLPANKYYHAYPDKDGILWLATDKGLIRWDNDAGKYLLYNKADGLSNDVIYAVYEDQFSNLWLSSDYGIIRFNKLTGIAHTYLVKDGISHNEFNRISHFKDANGRIYFGGLNGVTAFNPADFQKSDSLPDPPLVVLAFHQFNGVENRLVDQTATFKQSLEIVLQPDDRYFELEFALLSFQDAKQNRYAYQIKGIHDDWQYQREKTLRFGRLPYGQYTLHIKAQDATGKWSKKELLVTIRILRPFYLEAWFLVLMVLLVSFAGPAYFKWRTLNLRKTQARLEKEVALQTRTIRQQAEELRHLDTVKSRFFANVSHELRTPLTLMNAPIGTVLRSGQLDNHNFTLLKLAMQNGQKLMQLINEILDLSKMEAGKMELQESPQVLLPLLRRQLSQFESYALDKGVELTFEYQAETRLQVKLDVPKFEIIFNNLLSNALKFTPHDGKVRVVVQDKSSVIRLQVADTGQGIHPDDLPHVFDRFFQSKQPDLPAQGGTGIGLALCWEYAHLFGGVMTVDSKPGEGSTFTFEFPKKEVMGFAKPEEPLVEDLNYVHKTTINPVPDTSKPALPCILLVEDNPDLRHYIQMILSDRYELICAENGQDALALLDARVAGAADTRKSGLVDLIISDIMMPVMDGIQLLERLKGDNRYCHIPVIMLTARADMRDKLRALRIGVDDYLLKPFDEEELRARIESLIQNHRDRRQPGEVAVPEEDKSAEPPVRRTALSVEDQLWLQELEQVVLNHFDDYSLSADIIADKLALSRRQFFRRVKALTGKTPNEYFNEARYSRARQLLEDRTYKTVKEVSYAVGLRDTVYFSQQFTQRFGKQPSSYLS